jgi:peptidoglycan/LPS O-acetylase OafA/YrhL
VMAVAIVARTACAWLSWRLVEAPVLRLKPPPGSSDRYTGTITSRPTS